MPELRAELYNFRIIISKIETLQRKYKVKVNKNVQRVITEKKRIENNNIREYNKIFRVDIIALLNALGKVVQNSSVTV